MTVGYLPTIAPPPIGRYTAHADGQAMYLWGSAAEAIAALPRRVMEVGPVAIRSQVVPVGVDERDIVRCHANGSFEAITGVAGEPLSLAEVIGETGGEVVARLRELADTPLTKRGARAMQVAWRRYLTTMSVICNVDLTSGPFAGISDYTLAHDRILADLSGDTEDVFHVREAIFSTALAIIHWRLGARSPELAGAAGHYAAMAVASETLGITEYDGLAGNAWDCLREGGVPTAYRRWGDQREGIVVVSQAVYARRWAHIPQRFAPSSSSWGAEVKRRAAMLANNISGWLGRQVSHETALRSQHHSGYPGYRLGSDRQRLPALAGGRRCRYGYGWSATLCRA